MDGGCVMRQLNPIDAQFIDAEDQDRHISFAIASIAIFEGPAPSREQFLRALTERLPRIPLYRQKLRTVPLRLGPPVWVDDPDFDLRYHVRQVALPAPGDDAQLSELMARVMSQRLDRDYPLWEYWVIRGLSGDRWALISKVHHCMVDGVSGTDLYRVIFDSSAEAGQHAAGDQDAVPESDPLEAAEPEPSALTLAVRAAAGMARLPVRQAAVLRGLLSRPSEAASQIAQTARAIASLAPAILPAAESSLCGPIGRQRRYVWARASLADIKTIKNELGGTVNDVVLAAISGGYRDLLLSRGEEPGPHMVPSLVPVSLRAAGEESIYENRISILMTDLPVHLADPIERLTAIRTQLAALKASKEAVAGEALVALGRLTPYPFASLSVRLAYRLPQREIVTVTTNVPGPSQPLYAMGRRLLEIIPYVPIATTLRTGVSILSYNGNLAFGVTGDYATTPDIEVLARGIESSVAELLAAAQPRPKAAPKSKPQPEAKAPPQPKPQPEPKAAPQPKAPPKPEPEAKASPKPEPKAAPQPKAPPKPEPQAKTAAQPKAAPKPEAKAASRSRSRSRRQRHSRSRRRRQLRSRGRSRRRRRSEHGAEGSATAEAAEPEAEGSATAEGTAEPEARTAEPAGAEATLAPAGGPTAASPAAKAGAEGSGTAEAPAHAGTGSEGSATAEAPARAGTGAGSEGSATGAADGTAQAAGSAEAEGHATAEGRSTAEATAEAAADRAPARAAARGATHEATAETTRNN